MSPGASHLYRLHDCVYAPLYFGPRDPPQHRFDDPAGEFGTCYMGLSLDVAVAEAVLRDPPVRVVGHSYLAGTCVSLLEAPRLRLVQAHGPGLARLGVPAELTSGPESGYAESRRFAHALWAHADRPDGILYRARHDDDELAVALFDRAVRPGLAGTTRLLDHSREIHRLARKYELGLDGDFDPPATD